MKIYLVRHGESQGNAKRELYGTRDYPLTEKGIADAKLVGEKLRDVPITRCYTSTLARAYTTAELALAGRNIEITRHDELMEQHFGIYEGLPFDEIKGRTFEEALHTLVASEIPGGESYPVMAKRAIDFVKAHLEDNVLFVAHNGPLAALTTYFLGLGLHEAGKFSYGQGTFTMIEWREDFAKLRQFNA